jgi:hypothetical protein
MAWPDHIKAGGIPEVPARTLISDIISVCYVWLEEDWIGEIARGYYEKILAHALLDRANHAHGLLRDLVKQDGSGEVPNPTANLDQAWDQVRGAYDKVMLPAPSLNDLRDALDGIDHGGGGA